MQTPKIGQAPADDLVDLAQRVRDVANELLRIHEGDHAHVAEARETLDEAVAKLGAIASRHEAPRAVEAVEKEGTRPYYFPGALAPRVHVAHPWMTAEEMPEGRRGRVRFDLIHEGPPGCAHGGHVAWFFDQAFGHHVVAQQIGGPTHRLEVVYRRLTPLQTELDYEIRTDRVDGRKIFADGVLRHGDDVVAEAKALFVAPKAGFEMTKDGMTRSD
ncbi:MAG: hotdog fold thioesterase [bacterium]|nr:hotdog fold thioesterase [bacterium]